MNSAISEDTVIEVGKSIPIKAFREFFEEATGKTMPGSEFNSWLNLQAGKPLKEAMKDYGSAAERKNMEEILSDDRFSILSEGDKAFILDFDEKIQKFGYDFGGGIGEGHCWGKYMIIYSKTGVKSKKVIARIYIREDGIILRLFLNGINKHAAYIENAPKHIKDVFVGTHGDCSCNPKQENCRARKTYVMEGKQFEKCGGVVFEFWNPSVEKCQDYIHLLEEFYPVKKPKRA